MHAVCFIRIKEQVGEKRGTVIFIGMPTDCKVKDIPTGCICRSDLRWMCKILSLIRMIESPTSLSSSSTYQIKNKNTTLSKQFPYLIDKP
jgi:hypothetical protein